GEGMWWFGLGIFLIDFSPGSLRLSATYGLATGCVSLLFSALLGDWVDHTPRLKAVRISLVLQKLTVFISASIICILFWLRDEIANVWQHKAMLQLGHALVITTAVLTNLASMTKKIAMERDWIVEICSKQKDSLASLSAMMRAIDMISRVLSPLVMGQVLDLTELGYGAVLIAAWNLLSVILEFYLLRKIYESVPALKSKMYKARGNEESSNAETKETDVELRAVDLLNQDITVDNEEKEETRSFSTVPENVEKATNIDDVKKQNNSEDKLAKEKQTNKCTLFVERLFHSFISLYKGWRIYIKYDIALAGIGLALLYVTVLGFHNITIGYGYSQGLSASVLGGLQMAAYCTGMLGTILYPRIRRRVGTERTGEISLTAQITFLCLCVASVFAQGSPFRASHDSTKEQQAISMIPCNATYNQGLNRTTSSFSNITSLNASLNTNHTLLCKPDVDIEPPEYNVSIWLLMVGIIGSRVGLWMADLAIAQLYLERVVESERGIIGGVQNALNYLMEMLKYTIVVILPHSHQFGLLVFISFGFICSAWILYTRFAYKAKVLC
ncbi:hypothetical protein FSP39_005685, partial [Pinctada imbricata]